MLITFKERKSISIVQYTAKHSKAAMADILSFFGMPRTWDIGDSNARGKLVFTDKK